MEFVFGIVGLIIGIGGGWLLWDRIGSRRLNDDFARRLKHTDEQIALERRRADAAEEELEPLRRELREAKDRHKETQKQLDKLKGRFEKLKVERDEVEASITALRDRAAEAEKLEPQLAEARSKLAAAFADNAAVKAKLGEVEGLERQLASARDRLVEAERAKEDARLRAAEAEGVTQRATVELEASMETIATLRSAAETALRLQREIDSANSTISRREQLIAQQKEELQRLEEQLAASAVDSDAHATAATEAVEIDVATQAVDPDSGDVDGSTDVEDTPADEGDPVESTPVDEVASAVRGSDDGLQTEQDANQPPPGGAASAAERMREVAERTAGGKPPANDDLKKIHGVGPKLEKLLKGMGITSFLQVANFTAGDIETVTEALDAFPGRIERDDWVGSADQLYRDKYEDE